MPLIEMFGGPSAADLVAGDGLARTGNVLDVNVDPGTLEIVGDALRVKAGVALPAGAQDETLRHDGSAWSATDKLKVSDDGTVTITPDAAATGLQVMATAGVNVPAATVQNNSSVLLRLSNTAAPGSTGGAAQQITTGQQPTADGHRLGAVLFGWDNGGTFVQGAQISAFANEDWTSNRGSFLSFRAVTPGTSTPVTEHARFYGGGDWVFNATGSALATNATRGFLHIPNSAGAPTGSPAVAHTGASPLHYDTDGNRLYVRDGSAWLFAQLQKLTSATNNTSITPGDWILNHTGAGGDGTFTLPLANAYPAGTTIRVARNVASSSDPVVQRAGADNIVHADADVTSVTLDGTTGKRSLVLVTDGSSRWYTMASH